MDTDNDDILKGEWYLELKKLREERSKTLKSGDNVIHLEYLGGLLDINDIAEIENRLKQADIELSRFDSSGFPKAALEDYLNVVFVAIQTPLISNILTGVFSNFVWESIKFSVIKVWFNTRQKKITKFTSRTQEKKNVTFGLEVSLDKNTSFNFRLDGDLSEKTIDKSLDKILNFLKEQKLNESYKHQYFMTYNSTLDNWEKLDVEEELRKEILKKKNK